MFNNFVSIENSNNLYENINYDVETSDIINSVGLKISENLDASSMVFSPFGIVCILSIIQIATANTTNKQLLDVLGTNFDIDQIKNMYQQYTSNVMKIVNVFVFNKIKKINMKYIDLIKDITVIALENFNKPSIVNQKINRYVEKKSDGFIKDIIPKIDIRSDTSIILANTVYFKGSWKYKFDIQETKIMTFHKTNNIPIMHQINYFNYYENTKIQLVELPYDEKEYVMGIILPIKFMEESDLEYSLSNIPYFSFNEINEYINNLKLTKIDLYLPKFIHHKKMDLVKFLEKMQVQNLFEPNKANLNLISKGAFVSKIIQETILIVDELGIESPNRDVRKINTLNSKLFKANHAFIYYIRYLPDNTFLIFGDYQGN